MSYENPPHPRFCDWVIRSRYLHEPFRLIDAGVQGGIHERWRWFGDQLEVFAFDPLEDAIAILKASNPDITRFHYFQMGLGNEDGERLFERTDNSYGSAFLPSALSEADIGKNEQGELPTCWSTLRINKLDTLIKSGAITMPDFIKLDCEGFETEIIKGAGTTLASATLFGIESESSLKLHPWYKPCHFVELYGLLAPARFEVKDLYFYRSPVVVIERAGPDIGPPDTFDFLFLRSPALNADSLIKFMMVAELFVLPDVALQALHQYSSILGNRFDLATAERNLRDF